MNASLLAGIIGGLTLLLFVALFVAVKWGGLVKIETPAAQPGKSLAPRPTDLAPPAKLRTTIAIAMRELRVLVAGGRGPTEVPWALIVGAGTAACEPLLPPPLHLQHEISWLDDQRLAKVGTVSFRDGGVVVGFADGLVEAPQPQRRLLDLLRAVEIVRPLRPLDALVVVVPCSVLIAAAEAPEAAAARGRQLYEIILTVQQRTGWRVPVYVLLSGAEEIAGFTPVARAVLEHSVNPIIGWPAPKALDSMFDPTWIDEAFAALRTTLSTEQIHLLMELDDDKTAEEVLLFPDRLAEIRPALAALLGQMLENSAYHEGFMLRGIFLTGDTGGPRAESGPETRAPDAPLPLPAARESTTDAAILSLIVEQPPQPLADTLFRRKIFPESGLAQPAYGEMTRRHRMVRRAKIALAASVALFLLGMAAIPYQTGRHYPPIRALLSNVEQIEDRTDLLNKVMRESGTGTCREPARARLVPPGDRNPFEESRALSIELLQRMSDLDINRVQTILAPTSFFSPVNGKVRAAIRSSFHDVVFNAIADSMATRAGIDALVSRNAPMADGARYWQVTVDNTLIYNKNYRLATQMASMPAAHAAAVKNFAGLVDYALFEQLPPGFTRNYELYSDGIAGYAVPCLSDRQTREDLQGILSSHYAHAIDRLYIRNRLTETINSIAARFTPVDGIDSSDASLAKLVTELDTIAAELAATGKYGWVYVENAQDLSLLPVEQLKGLEAIDASFVDRLPEESREIVFQAAVKLRSSELFDAPLLAEDFAPAPAAAAQPPATGGASALAAAAAPGTPAPAATETVAVPRLSKAAADSREFLRTVFAQPYMDSSAPPAEPYSGTRISWDLGKLQVAQKTVDNYAAFVASGSGDTPIALRNIALASAEQHFAHYLGQLVEEAAQPLTSAGSVAMPGVDAETANFVQALPLLVKIRNALRGAGAEDSATRVDARVANQAGRLLGDADRALAADGGPYAIDPAGLAAWDETGSLAAALFGVETVDDLKATLPQRRARVADIARSRAAPLIGYLREPGTAADAATLARANKWQGILQTLDSYDANSPSNSLARLEQYIAVDLDRLQKRQCAHARGFTTRSSDYFAAQQAAISARVVGHCRRVAAGDTEARFEQVRDSFNATLAGRFPFASDSEAPAADPSDVQAFFREFGPALQPLKTDIDATPGFGNSGRAASIALDQLIRVQAALAPMLDAAGPAPLTYGVGVTFFTDPDLSQGQDQVIEASLGTPSSKALARGNQDSFVWSNGQPVLARFRWAINAPSIPLTGGKCVPQPGGSYAGFRVDGDWAVLRLLRRYAPDRGAPGSGAAAVPVAFSVKLCANQARASGGEEVEDARILVRLSLSATARSADKPDRQVPVVIPDFPYTIDPLVRIGAPR